MSALPVFFFGHGSPMNAIESNRYSEAWIAIGKSLPRPKAILAISAHWYVRGTRVTAGDHPKTIHDFGGFPQALFEVQYPAPGSPWLAERAAQVLDPVRVDPDVGWGIDHGTWSVLRRLFPAAEVPVVQLSLDRAQPPGFHFEAGRKLGVLRDEGVLIVASGNVVHNLPAMIWEPGAPPFEWAERFDALVRAAIEGRQFDRIVDPMRLGADAALSVPTLEHYLPLLYALGAVREDDPIAFPVEGIEGGSISMLAVAAG